jgi:hypothetical protein
VHVIRSPLVELLRAMSYRTFGDSIVPALNTTRKIVITPEGIQWAERINCRRIPGVFN